jgi:UDP-N-acetylglucosamine--N-acetylmuramyl-(pentapeptide) pyrophosphoryl-undecaprenol N-acetylglucosamine transferase
MTKLKVIISGGGTGGHIFPAIAIANAIKEKRQEAEILFVGALGRMEMEKVPEAGYKIIGLPIMGLQRSLSFKNIKFPFKLLKSLRKARGIIKEFQPQVAIGVGGYASGPMLRAAKRKGIPILIQEQNSYAGLTNKILGKKADRICVAYENMERFFPKDKIVKTGNPVRAEVIKLEGKKDRAIEFFELHKEKKTLLIVGGSLGAWSINEGVAAALENWQKQNFQLIWQTGKSYYERAVKEAEPYGEWVKVHQFIKRMDLAYASADLIVSRAGALAVSEISLIKKPTIFVPFPSAAENHQYKNAMALKAINAALILKDAEVKEKLGNEVETLIHDEDRLQKLSKNLQPQGYADAANLIADEALKIALEK